MATIASNKNIADGDVTDLTAIELSNNFATVQVKFTGIDSDNPAEVHIKGSVDDTDYDHIPDNLGRPLIVRINGSGNKLLPILGLDGVPFIKVEIYKRDATKGVINYIKVI